MKFLYKDLINFLSEKPSKELLSEKLFQLGHEHEIINDVFDMDITPNRGDCLSIKGLARDLNVFFPNHDPTEIYSHNIDNLNLDFENLSIHDCPKITFLEIEITGEPSSYKPYLENFFQLISNNKTNFFTDISNYISYELGQPTHCYDRDKIKNKLIFRNEKHEVPFLTLHNDEIILKDKNCIFETDNNVISLAGVMGGASTACSNKTNKALIECAYFNPESIIGKSIKYNLTSDAAHKFERGVDISCQEFVLRRFIKIVEDHASIKSLKIKEFDFSNIEEKKIPINVKKINNILGIDIQEYEYLDYIKKLGFLIEDEIIAPHYRHDIKTENDLAEEIARFIGYDNIKSKPLSNKILRNKKTIDKKVLLKNLLVNNGFHEVINFPFTSIHNTNSITLDNPLDSNKKNMRLSLKEALIENLLYNEKRQKDSIKLFEISDIYYKNPEILLESRIGIIISGRLGHNYRDFSKKLDKNYLTKILNANLDKDFFNIEEIPRASLNTKRKDKIFYVELPLDKIPSDFYLGIDHKEKSINFIRYNRVSEFPSSTRDFSFSITNFSAIDRVIDNLMLINDDIIKDSFIFDFYKNESKGLVKLGCRFVFQSSEKTLSDVLINSKIKEIISPLTDIEGVYIDGM